MHSLTDFPARLPGVMPIKRRRFVLEGDLLSAAEGADIRRRITSCPISSSRSAPGSIFTSAGSNTILPPSEPLFSILTSITAAAAKLVMICIAAASRSSALCIVISCHLALTAFDDIRDVKATEENGWRG
ncbi:hypothetical protein [Bradyrhizobium sp. WSM2254]|uniref:hypothetical protein n=1 Tax=Bradyrhizobium sp. WSM2254 TaxID=1188263 RepID=UPI00042A2C99